MEWTLFFKNTGKADTPILSEILALDTRLSRTANGEFVLHRIKGDDSARTAMSRSKRLWKPARPNA